MGIRLSKAIPACRKGKQAESFRTSPPVSSLKGYLCSLNSKILKNFLSFSTAMSTLNFTARLVHPSISAICSYHNDGFYGSFTPTSGVVTIFGAGGKDGKAFMSKVAKEMKKKGVWSTDSPLHAYRHELGHAIQEQLSASDSNYAEKLKMITDFRKSILDDLTKLPERDIIKEKAKILSVYGIDETDDIDEFISEGIAEYLNGKPRSTAKKIVNILLGRG